jgi:hypothetical protein
VFKDSTPIAFGAAPTVSAPLSTSLKRRRRDASAAEAAGPSEPLPDDDVITAACCRVRKLSSLRASLLHADGALVAASHATGWELRDPGVASLRLQPDGAEAGVTDFRTGGPPRLCGGRCLQEPAAGALRRHPALVNQCLGFTLRAVGEADTAPLRAAMRWPKHIHARSLKNPCAPQTAGLYEPATHVAADAANGLVWCAGDGGDRIKAFSAPAGGGGGHVGRYWWEGSVLQYTLWSGGEGAAGGHAGLHVWGTRVLAIKGELAAPAFRGCSRGKGGGAGVLAGARALHAVHRTACRAEALVPL